MKKSFKAVGALAGLSLLLAACQGNNSNTASPSPSASQTMDMGTKETKGFETFGYNYQLTRNAPFTQIAKDNVKGLGLAWQVDYQQLDKDIPGGIQGFPIVVDGVMYATTSYNYLFAFDAATGKELWRWKPDQIGTFKNFGLNCNRGVAVGEGKVFMLTLDNKIVAIDQKTGKLVQEVKLSDTMPEVTGENGYYETVAPVYYKGNLYVGSSGADNGVRGFMMAFKASDLTPAWDQPFWNVPPKGTDWLKADKFQGGGTVWMPASIDPDTGLMYYGTANPAPDFYGSDRPGANKNTDSVIALDSKTGKLVWAHQLVSHDLWDYDAAASPMILTAKVGGKDRKIVVEGGKNGQWYAFDAATGEVIYDGVPFTKISHPNPTPEGVLAFPGALGGENFAPETYDPQTNYVLIPSVEQGMIIKSAKNSAEIRKSTPGAVDFGTAMVTPADSKDAGNIVAIDVNTGKIVYKKDTASSQRGGFTSTASGLAFFGDGEGNMNAMDIKTGDILWTFQTGAPIASAPSVYMQDGVEYVAISVGGTFTSSGGGHKAKLMVFKLGGDPTQAAKDGNAGQAGAGHGGTAAADFKAQEGKWIAFDKAKKTVDLLLIGSYDGAQSGMNFNGYANGDMKVTIPKDWTVNVRLQNSSAQMPHSAMIVSEKTKGTIKDFKESFKGATTPDPLAGFVGKESQDFSFKADSAGAYLIWCAIPGHGSAGMYDTMIVDSKATEPSIALPTK